VKGLPARLARVVREFLEAGDRVARAGAVGAIEAELAELEQVFALLVLGSLVGLPSPPTGISLELMPVMEEELLRLVENVDTARTPISRLFSTFDIG